MQDQDLRHETVLLRVRTVRKRRSVRALARCCPVERRSAMFGGEVRVEPCVSVCGRAGSVLRLVGPAARPFSSRWRVRGPSGLPACAHRCRAGRYKAALDCISEVQRGAGCHHLAQQDRIAHRMCARKVRTCAGSSMAMPRTIAAFSPTLFAARASAGISSTHGRAPAGPEIQQHAAAAVVVKRVLLGRRDPAAQRVRQLADRCACRQLGERGCGAAAQPPDAAASTARAGSARCCG